MRFPAHDEPEPDIAIVRGTDADYRRRIPTAADVGAAGRGLRLDTNPGPGQEAPGLRQERIPVYWIINLVDRQVEVYTGPGQGGYQSRKDFKPGQQVPVMIAGQRLPPIAVDDLLP